MLLDRLAVDLVDTSEARLGEKLVDELLGRLVDERLDAVGDRLVDELVSKLIKELEDRPMLCAKLVDVIFSLVVGEAAALEEPPSVVLLDLLDASWLTSFVG